MRTSFSRFKKSIRFKELISKMKSLLTLIFVVTLALSWAKSPLQTTHQRGILSHSEGVKGTRNSAFLKNRLPTGNVIPEHYALELVPNFRDVIEGFELYDCRGEVTITVIAIASTNEIYINMNGIEVTGAGQVGIVSLTEGEASPAIVSVETVTAEEFLVITLGTALIPTNRYDVTIIFTSTISSDPNDLNGLYVSSYTDPDGNQIPVLSTQFETTGAREVFPCFDEPEMKATYTISLAYNPSAGYIALGNEGQQGEEVDYAPIPGWRLKTFSTTVSMSSYLVAILVGNYACVVATPGENDDYQSPTQVCAPPHLAPRGAVYPAEQSTRLLNYFQVLTGIDYQLSKMDSVSIPLFDAGAMENWGLNTYRPEILLYYENESTEASRLQTTMVLAHELFHQWFGNLVTCNFWDQIWLNEGFVTYFQYLGIDDIRPGEYLALEWRQYDVFQYAMDFDATSETHPLINAAHTWGTTYEDYETGVFDGISYEKGGSLLRMMEGFLTPPIFIQGLRNYLTEFSYQDATQDDVFTALQALVVEGTFPGDLTVKSIMDTWSLQSGYPLVRVKKASDTRIYISQERFGNLEAIYTPELPGVTEPYLDRNHLWTIPITIATAAEPNFDDHTTDVWIEKSIAVTRFDVDSTQWIVVNSDGLGYFRVLYDPSLFELLLAQFNEGHEIISPMSRSQIIDDYFNFYRHGYSNVETALRLTSYLGGETSAVVWAAVFSNLEEFLSRLSGTTAYAPFQTYMQGILDAALTEIGLPQPVEEFGIRVMMRRDLLDWACLLQHVGCREYGVTSFLEWVANPLLVRVDVRPIVFCAAVGSDPAHYDTALAQYNTVDPTSPDRTSLLNALACTENEDRLNALLGSLIAETSEILAEHRLSLLLRIAEHSVITRTAAIAYVRDNFDAILIGIPSGNAVIVNFFTTLSIYIGSNEEIEILQGILLDHADVLEEDLDDLEALLDIMRGNVEWRAEYVGRLQTWFNGAN